MPCNDLTELLTIKLDLDDRILDYSLQKLTCRKPIGVESFILNDVKGKKAQEIIKGTSREFFKSFNDMEEVDKFLSDKHLQAIKSGLELLVDNNSAPLNCFLNKMSQTDKFTEIEIEIESGTQKENIKSCCSGCKKL